MKSHHSNLFNGQTRSSSANNRHTPHKRSNSSIQTLKISNTSINQANSYSSQSPSPSPSPTTKKFPNSFGHAPKFSFPSMTTSGIRNKIFSSNNNNAAGSVVPTTTAANLSSTAVTLASSSASTLSSSSMFPTTNAANSISLTFGSFYTSSNASCKTNNTNSHVINLMPAHANPACPNQSVSFFFQS